MTFTDIKEAHDQFIGKGGLFLFELEILNDEYLLVDLTLTDKGILFEADFIKPVSFDGDIIPQGNNVFLCPFDYSYELETLDHYLQEINNNILEGYLIPNNLYK